MTPNSEPFDLSGTWYRDDPDNSSPGVLEEIPGRGLTLTVLGTLTSEEVGSTVPEVLGAAGGRKVVLVGVTLVRTERSGLVTNRQEFLVDSALVGTHTLPSKLLVTGAAIRLTGLGSWFVETPFRQRGGDDEVGVMFTPSPSESAQVTNGTVTLSTGVRTAWSADSMRLDAISSMYIELESPVSYRKMTESWVSRLRNLNSLVTSHPSSVLSLEILSADQSGERVEVRGIPTEPGSSAMPPVLTALDLGLPEVDFEGLVTAWCSLCDKHGPSLNQYFANLYGPAPQADVQLLRLLVVLETFHRHQFPHAAAMPPAKFKERKARILDLVREEGLGKDLKWLKGKFRRLNDPSLSKRLKQLAELTNALDDVVEDWEACCKQLEATRNFLAHGEPKLAPRALTPDQFEPAVRLLDSWIRALIWTQLGFSDSRSKHMVRRTQSFHELKADLDQPWIRRED